VRFAAAGVARPVRSTGCRRPPFRRCCSLLIILQGISSGIASTSKQPCTSLRRGLLVHIHGRGRGAGRLLAGWNRTRLDPAAEAVSVRVVSTVVCFGAPPTPPTRLQVRRLFLMSSRFPIYFCAVVSVRAPDLTLTGNIRCGTYIASSVEMAQYPPPFPLHPAVQICGPQTART